MKATIIGRPEFRFELTVKQIEILIECSRAHYDIRCQAASKPGGFIYGWWNNALGHAYIEAEDPSGQPLLIRATFYHLDICTKILECASSIFSLQENEEKIQAARSMRLAFSKLMNVANEVSVSSTWKTQIDV